MGEGVNGVFCGVGCEDGGCFFWWACGVGLRFVGLFRGGFWAGLIKS